MQAYPVTHAWECSLDQVGLTARFWVIILGGVMMPIAVILWVLLAL